MLPIQFLFLTVWPVIDMRLRCKTGGKDYPPGVPSDIKKVLELGIVSHSHTSMNFFHNFVSLSLDLFQSHSFSDKMGAQRT